MKYRRSSLNAVFLSVISHICNSEMAFSGTYPLINCNPCVFLYANSLYSSLFLESLFLAYNEVHLYCSLQMQHLDQPRPSWWVWRLRTDRHRSTNHSKLNHTLSQKLLRPGDNILAKYVQYILGNKPSFSDIVESNFSVKTLSTTSMVKYYGVKYYVFRNFFFNQIK